jgi:hypothetical protein
MLETGLWSAYFRPMNAVTPSSLTDDPSPEAGPAVCASAAEPLDMTDDEQDAFQLRSLNAIVASGARLVQRMEEQIVKADWITADGPLLFETLARTMRRTVALQRRISEDRRKRRRERVVERKAQVRQVVTKAIEAKVAQAKVAGPDATPVERERLDADREDLLRDLKERLDDPEFETMVLLPVYETVALICRELDIPVPAPWAERALAEARAEIAARVRPPKPPPRPSLSVPWRPPFVSATDPPTAL